MSLKELGQLFLRLSSICSTILSVVFGINTVLTDPNGPSSLPTIALLVRNISVYLADNVVGLPAVRAMLLAVDDDVNTQAAAILAAIAALSPSSGPVTLPTIPPPGYGAPSGSDIFDAVWSGTHYSDASTPYTYLKYGGIEGYSRGNSTGYRPDGGIFAYMYTELDSAGVHPSYYPSQDFGAILVADTLQSWLERINPTASIFRWSGVGSAVGVDGNNGDGTAHFLTTIDEAGFQSIKESLGLTSALSAAPVWPGLAGVTLGAPVDIGEGVTITAPMHGVIVNLTSEPAKAGYYDFDGARSYRNLGALSFFTDDGEQEFPQSFGFTSAVYSPKSMALAAGVKIRATGGVAGTVTPWVIGS